MYPLFKYPHREDFGVWSMGNTNILTPPLPLKKYRETVEPRLPEDLYASLLFYHLRGDPRKEIRFFLNSRRFAKFRSLMGARLPEIWSVLNVASGPFAFENYVQLRRDARIDSFDIDPRLDGLFRDLSATGKFSDVRFQTSCALEYETQAEYDLVLINDLFYHCNIDFQTVIEKYARRVRSGGYLYFDILDRRAARVWKFTGRDNRFARYEMHDVANRIERLGFEIETILPSMGVGGLVDQSIRRTLYATSRIANNFIFVARKV